MAGTTNQALEEKKKEERKKVRNDVRKVSADNLDDSDNSNDSDTEDSQTSLEAVVLDSLIDSL